MKVCYVGGAGHLGWPMALWTAHRGVPVIVADINVTAVQEINDGTFHSSEPGVDDLFMAVRATGTISATASIQDAVVLADVIFILVNTPSLADGGLSIRHVNRACCEVGEGLKNMDGYKVVVIASTVMPGNVNGALKAALEEHSGKRAHHDFGLCYCPEFIRRQNILDDFARPEYVVIGYESNQERQTMYRHFEAILENWDSVRAFAISIESAEVAKIGLNVSITAKIARANELALLCHHVAGADAVDVLRIIGADSRIGPKCLSPGPPPGGPCFPRDDAALESAMRQCGLTSYVSTATMDFNAYLMGHLAMIAYRFADADAVIGILGLSYKPGNSSLEGSPGLALAQSIHDSRPDLHILAYDSNVNPADLADCDYVEWSPGLEQIVAQSEILVLMMCCPEFRALENMDLAGTTLLDTWGYLADLHLDCHYIRFGSRTW